ncbi:DUF6631 family protein [Pasteurella multocida]|uniref:DUF6631 family protein n=1 Tax=Pasteurella multocida TaxID=747 RepID=UPI00292E2D69|nr:DUF6631 family protein [Pasteurella multocida]WNY75973.1 hypothetical protein H2513_08830 [Pasteurella multocida]
MIQKDQQTEQHDELAILFPEQYLTLNGEEVKVKEYSLAQQLQYRQKMVPFIAHLRQSLGNEKTEFNMDKLLDCLSQDYQNVLELVALSINKPVDFVANLTGEEAEQLLLSWWAVNSDFFTLKAVMPLLEKTNQSLNQIGATS